MNVLPRLCRGELDTISYTDPRNGKEVFLSFHSPSMGEKAAAAALSNIEFTQEGGLALLESAPFRGTAGLVVALEGLYFHLALFCIERAWGESLDIPVSSHVEKYPGMPWLGEALRAQLYAPALCSLGKHLWAIAQVSEGEKKASEL